MALIPQEARAWSRVRLDREPADLDADDLAYALNADLFLEPGTIRIRRGKDALFPTALSALPIRVMAKVANTRYQIADQTLYRNQTAIWTLLSSINENAIQAARPLNDTTTWAFIADAYGMIKDDGTSLVTWGVAAPTTAATANIGLTGLTGSYMVQYTYCRKVGATLVTESNPSPSSTPLDLTNQGISLLIPVSDDPQVTHIRIYRTAAGGSIFLYDQEITNVAFLAGQAMAFSTRADSALGAAVSTDNDPPTACAFVSAPFFDRHWLCGNVSYPQYLWYSKRFQPEVIPAANYLLLGTPDDPLQCFMPFGGVGIAFSSQRKYRVVGSGTSTFTPYETPGKRGTLSPRTAIIGEDGVYFVARDGIFRTTGFSGDEQLAGPILPLFQGDGRNGYLPVNFGKPEHMSIAIWKGRLYFSYADTEHETANMVAVNRLGTNQWQFYGLSLESLYTELDTDYLLGGGYDGKAYILETGTNDAEADIALDVITKDYAHVTPESPSGSTARKLYHGIHTDCSPGAGITEAFYADGTLKHTDTVTQVRVPSLRRLPADAQGYRWKTRWTYTGQETVKIYGVNVLAQPL